MKCVAGWAKQTSVGEPKSAEGLQVLVSGRAVPALLRTGEDGAALAGGSGMLEVWRKMPCLWRRAHVELQLRRSSYNSWTWRVTEKQRREKLRLQCLIQYFNEIIYVFTYTDWCSVVWCKEKLHAGFSCQSIYVCSFSQYTQQTYSLEHGNSIEYTFNTWSLLWQLSALKDKPNTPQVGLIYETRFKCIFAKVWLKQLHWGVLM